MIEQHFPSLKKPILPPFKQHITQLDNWNANKVAQARNITVAEFWRRNNIVLKLASNCPIHKGKVYKPLADENFTKYGLCEAVEVFKTYWDFPDHDKWPEDNEPYIITLRTEKQQGLILCTPNWLNWTPQPVAHC